MNENWKMFEYQKNAYVKQNIKERTIVFSEADEWGCACWRNNAKIELDVGLVR